MGKVIMIERKGYEGMDACIMCVSNLFQFSICTNVYDRSTGAIPAQVQHTLLASALLSLCKP